MQLIITLQTIQNLAQQVGFDASGVSPAEALTECRESLNHWLLLGLHGEMEYMERNFEKRIDPTLLVPGAKSIISLLVSYNPGDPPISTAPPKISRFALGRDYHLVLKAMLYQFLERLNKDFGKVKGRAFVDSAPVLERAWAQKAGLGWIGKNGLLINHKLGSYVFIGELIVNLDIEPSPSVAQARCGSCTKCIDACPTGAIVAPHIVDARKCISYLNIEKKGSLNEAENRWLNGWLVGCDICQEVCPWNGGSQICTNIELMPLKTIETLNISQLSGLSFEEWKKLTDCTALQRISFEKFKQLVAIYNEQEKSSSAEYV